jgi:hypothetical protein
MVADLRLQAARWSFNGGTNATPSEKSRREPAPEMTNAGSGPKFPLPAVVAKDRDRASPLSDGEQFAAGTSGANDTSCG